MKANEMKLRQALMQERGDRIELNEEQEAALSVMMAGRNVFLTGEAGTGKSTLVREFVRRCENCIVLAPTGIAALNAGGMTIHSAMLFKTGLLDPVSQKPLNDVTRCRLLRSAKTIVVDEISMVRSDLFCAMDARLRELAGGENKRRPFGGKQMILVGDFMQLPPVVEWKSDLEFMQERLGGKFAFETDLWQAAMFKTISLRTIHRQEGDALFRGVLNNMRRGNFDAAAKVINNHCLADKIWKDIPICLCTTNHEAREINEVEMRKLKGDRRKYTAEMTIGFDASACPAEEVLELSVGARVMVICNRYEDGELECVNGDRGVVTELNDDSVQVRLDNGKLITVEPHTWERYVYSHESDGLAGSAGPVRKVVGWFKQLPLRLAYAITIHKSQGLTFDRVNLRLGSRGCFDHGQLYTALSRCRSLEGLHLDRHLEPADLIIDDAVLKFYSSLDATAQSPDDDGYCYYDEAMQYYLRRIQTGNGDPIPSSSQQFEFDFAPRVYKHPDIDRLLRLHSAGLINKYDAPILNPLVESCRLAAGVTEAELAMITRLVAKYCRV